MDNESEMGNTRLKRSGRSILNFGSVTSGASAFSSMTEGEVEKLKNLAKKVEIEE